MPLRDWETWMWHQAEGLLHEAERIRWSFLESAAAARSEGLLGQSSWGPSMNVVEDEEALWVVTALPGVEVEEIEIQVQEEFLVISGQRSFPEHLRSGRVHIYEIPCGRFERRVRLPAGSRFLLGEKKLSRGLLSIELRKLS